MKNLLLAAILFLLSVALFAQDNSTLSATIIGSGSPQYNPERSGPSVLISYKNTKILVDMGNGTQANLDKANIKIKDLDGLLFTHHHLDHNEEFTPIFIHALLGGNTFTVAGPKPTSDFVSSILTAYKEDIEYRMKRSKRILDDVKNNYSVKNVAGGENFMIGDIKVSCTKVNHTIYTVAYRFEAGNQSIVISGDLSYSENLAVLAKNTDYLIIDSGATIKIGASPTQKVNNLNSGEKNQIERAHVTLDESSKMAKDANAKNLILTHFTAESINVDATTKELQKNYNGTIIFATDLMKIPLEKTTVTQNKTSTSYSYPIVDTNVQNYYSDTKVISKPSEGEAFYGQDATYIGNMPSYTNNNNKTITDNVTGLMWQQNMGEKMTYKEALEKASQSTLGGFTDWRIPTIKELYSLILFSGQVKGEKAITMFIDTQYFNQPLGDNSKAEREIDAQTWSSTAYVGRTMNKDETIFGVNFVDGRIKGYPKYNPRTKIENKMYFRMVRGNTQYGQNNFVDNDNGTISDLATGLMWQKADDGKGRDWQEALSYAENLNLAAYSDWRLPNAKELQSIVDYTRSPQTTQSPAINPVFETTEIKNTKGELGQYPYYWTSTTHLDGMNPYAGAVYIAFGEAQGKMQGNIMDVHGAGAQRSDPKSGIKESLPEYFGPQGDLRYVYNYVRCVRDIKPTSTINTENPTQKQLQANQPTKQEINRNSNSAPSFSQLLERMDLNNDNKISKSEAKGKIKENFDQLDANNDGFITENELKRRN